jgi:formylglycine-generating enzyme required for sulfatase activity
LAERSAHWNAKPENRRLPALWEDLNIRLFTRPKNWNQAQRKMMRQAGIMHSLRCGLVAILLASVTTAAITVRNNLVAENDRKRAESLVEVALAAPAEGLPYSIENLKPLQAFVVPLLKARFAEAERDRTQRLHSALALAQFGHQEQDYLIDSIAWAGSSEWPNIVTALRRSAAPAVDKVKSRFAEQQDPAQRARLAITLLHLGDTSAAEAALALGPDPSTRTAFTLDLEKWHVDPADYVEPLRATRDLPFRSGLILAAGRIPAAKEALSAVVLDQFQHAPDGATHSACDWTLRQWGIELPEVVGAASRAGPVRFGSPDLPGWFVNSQGQTMILIPAGSFTRKDEANDAKQQMVTLTRPFYLCNREVSVLEFQRFIDDPDYPVAEKPQKWQGVSEQISPTGAHPVQQVSWYDAVLYCNWLGRKHGLTPCYERTGKEKSGSTEYDAWRLVENADGYRLPTEAQWEYACRAGTTTMFSHGNDETQLAYAVFVQSTSHPCGGKLPNAWGLFDMHGNVWEWCHDSYAACGTTDAVEDPFGPSKGSDRVDRGGSWRSTARDCAAGLRSRDDPSNRYFNLGFRVASVPSSK